MSNYPAHYHLLMTRNFNESLGRYLSDETQIDDLIPQDIDIDSEEIIEIPPHILGQYSRVLRILKKNGYDTVGKVRKINLRDFKNITGVGKQTSIFAEHAFTLSE